jgi:hypothetical protein
MPSESAREGGELASERLIAAAGRARTSIWPGLRNVFARAPHVSAPPLRLLYDPRTCQLAEGAIKRLPTRPVQYRGPDYGAKFDDTTLFFDAILEPSGDSALLFGPPLANLRPYLENANFVALPSGLRCPFHIREMDRHSQIRVRIPRGTRSVALSCGLGQFQMALREDVNGVFRGRRVVLTLSKNNDLLWIKDWMRYARDVHGADAALIYDNASTAYTGAQLLSAIGSLEGIEVACVVQWPFKYGPQGIDEMQYWDSDFCQHGALEHARWTFLRYARGVLNADIDELVVMPSSTSLFAATERTVTGMLCYPGVWVYGFTQSAGTPRQGHSYVEFEHFQKPEFAIRPYAPSGYLNTKWTVVPWRCPARCQWTTHRIYGLRGYYTSLSMTRSITYRHYREINTHWHYDRSSRVPYDPDRFVRDDAMLRNFARVRWDR